MQTENHSSMLMCQLTQSSNRCESAAPCDDWWDKGPDTLGTPGNSRPGGW